MSKRNRKELSLARPTCTFPNCNLSFSTSGHLARHSRIHTGDKPHACPIEGCTKKFARKDNMLHHHTTHLRRLRADSDKSEEFIKTLPVVKKSLEESKLALKLETSVCRRSSSSTNSSVTTTVSNLNSITPVTLSGVPAISTPSPNPDLRLPIASRPRGALPDFSVFQGYLPHQSEYSPMSSPALSNVEYSQIPPNSYVSHPNSSLNLQQLEYGQQQMVIQSLQSQINQKKQNDKNIQSINQKDLVIQSPNLNLQPNSYQLMTPVQSPEFDYQFQQGQYPVTATQMIEPLDLNQQFNRYSFLSQQAMTQQPDIYSVSQVAQDEKGSLMNLQSPTPFSHENQILPNFTNRQSKPQFINHGRQRSFSMMEFSTGSEFMWQFDNPTRMRAPTDSLTTLSHDFGLDLNPGGNLVLSPDSFNLDPMTRLT